MVAVVPLDETVYVDTIVMVSMDTTLPTNFLVQNAYEVQRRSIIHNESSKIVWQRRGKGWWVPPFVKTTPDKIGK
jgi:hypothetical protein